MRRRPAAYRDRVHLPAAGVTHGRLCGTVARAHAAVTCEGAGRVGHSGGAQARCGTFGRSVHIFKCATGLPYRSSDARRLLHKKLRGLQHAARNIVLPEPYSSPQTATPDRYVGDVGDVSTLAHDTHHHQVGFARASPLVQGGAHHPPRIQTPATRAARNGCSGRDRGSPGLGVLGGAPGGSPKQSGAVSLAEQFQMVLSTGNLERRKGNARQATIFSRQDVDKNHKHLTINNHIRDQQATSHAYARLHLAHSQQAPPQQPCSADPSYFSSQRLPSVPWHSLHMRPHGFWVTTKWCK